MLLKKNSLLKGLLLTTYKFLLMLLMKKNKYKKVSGFASSLLKYYKFFKLGAQKYHVPKYQEVPFQFSGANFFYFKIVLKSAGFHFWKYKICFFFREKRGIHFHFQKCKEFFGGVNFFGLNFFGFLGLGWEVQGFIPRNSRMFLVLQLETFIS